MAPPWVLLDRSVDLCFDAEDDESAVAVIKNKVAVAKGLSYLRESTVAVLGTMKPDAVFLHPPGIATFRLLGSKSHRAVASDSRSRVACADKGLLVLYAGRYCGPGSNTRGCYLVYDAAAGVPLLSTVPPPPLASYLTCIGAGAVVLRRHAAPSSAYLLAELATTPERHLPDAELHLWYSDSPTPQWVKKDVRLPAEVSPAPGKHDFCADTAFSGPNFLCWADLLHGIVVCHHPWGPQDPFFRFIPLPDRCPAVGTSKYPHRPHMAQFRTIACVGGAIKLVTMEGDLEGWHFRQFRLISWTLSPDLEVWQEDGVFHLMNLWMTDEYRALNLPDFTPVCPVLSATDVAVVYAVVNDVDLRVISQNSGTRTEFDLKGQYVLGLDMHCNKIISTSQGRPASIMQLMPELLATDLCASLQGTKDRQREMEARDDAESGKRPRVD